MMERKKSAFCVDDFSYMTEYIAKSYENSFLKGLAQEDVVETADEVRTNDENLIIADSLLCSNANKLGDSFFNYSLGSS